MPFVTIDLLRGRTDDELDTIWDSVQEALVAELGVPERDRFQLVSEHDARSLRYDRNYLDMDRGEQFVLVRVTLAAGRTTAAKQAFYRRLSDGLRERIGLAPDDLAVALVENEREDWSFGRGLASYLELPRERWR